MIIAWIMSLNILWLRKILLFLFDHWKGILVGIAGLIVAVFLFKSCGKPSPSKPNERELQQINSQNEAERKQALNDYFERIDSERAVSDAERKEIIKEVEKDKRGGKNVTADDLDKLVNEK